MNTKIISLEPEVSTSKTLIINNNYNNVTNEYKVFQILKKKSLKIGFCESCTGGLISSKFSRISGVSEVFDRGIITYSNISKIEEVGVKPETLETFGAVSKETAFEMAKGLLNSSNSLDIVLSITGIAGPNGGTEIKPIGLVYVCISTRNTYEIIKCNFNGNRECIQYKATSRAFIELRKFLLNL